MSRVPFRVFNKRWRLRPSAKLRGGAGPAVAHGTTDGGWLTAVAGFLAAAALAWRCHGLGERCLWFDEAHSWRLAKFPWGEMVSRVRADVHTPFYFMTLKAWIAAFGDSPTAMRLLSVLWFGIALAATYLLAREVDFGPNGGRPDSRAAAPRGAAAGAVAVLLFSSSAFLFRYCQEVRMYTQELALFLGSSWLLLRSLRERARPVPWWCAYAAAATALAYTHNFALLAVVAQGCYAAPAAVRAAVSRGVAPWRDRGVRWGAASAVLVAVLYLPWVPSLREQRTRAAADFWTGDVDENMKSPFSASMWRGLALACVVHDRPDQQAPYAYDNPVNLLAADLVILAAVPAALALAAWRRDRLGGFMLTLITVQVLLFILLVFSSRRAIDVNRYYINIYASGIMGTAVLAGRLRNSALRWYLTAVVCGGMVYWTARHQGEIASRAGTAARGAADHIAGRMSRGDVLVCVHPAEFFPLVYHARGRFPVRQGRYPGFVTKHYFGGPLYRPEDFLDWDDVFALAVRRVWVFGRETDIDAAGIPSGWVRLEEKVYQEPIHFRGAPTLVLLGRRGPGGNETP